MFNFTNRQKRTYSVIDGEDDEPLRPIEEETNMTTAPPLSHQIDEVAFEGGARRNSEISTSKREHRWDHIENLDQFFALIYEYHQGNGFICIALRHGFALFQFLFVVVFSTFLLECINYDVLFNNKQNFTNAKGTLMTGKRHINDAIIPNCATQFNPLVVFCLFLAGVFWTGHLIRVGYRLLQLYEIKTFFNTILEVDDADLSNASWREVVLKICKVQPQLHLIINQEQLTPLDVYQRMLRYKNYLVAFVYNDILPPRVNVPFVGTMPYLTNGLKFNLDWLLFIGPWSPWETAHSLKPEYKDSASLEMLAKKMRQAITWMAIINFVFIPFVFLYQVLFTFFSLADLVKREPGVFGMRRYSNYGRNKLRHFNELDHELRLRLNRSYEFAVRYMDQFTSPSAEIFAKAIAFTCGSVLAVLFILSAWDEDVLNIEHVLTVMTVCGGIVLACRSFIPDENLVFCQDFLMKQIISNIHYAPETWLKEAHSKEVGLEFGQLFQMRAQHFVEELLSPVLTPFVLMFSVRPRASDIVLFFNQHSKYVDGVGDVCSYSLMNLEKDGDEKLVEMTRSTVDAVNPNASPRHFHVSTYKKQMNRAKIELSLLNFATQNPEWHPPANGQFFINRVKEMLAKEATLNPIGANPIMLTSLRELEKSLRSPLGNQVVDEATIASSMIESRVRPSVSASGAEQSHCEAPPRSFNAGTESSMMNSALLNSQSSVMPKLSFVQPRIVQEANAQALEMSMNALLVNRLLMSGQAQQNPAFGFSGYGTIAPLIPPAPPLIPQQSLPQQRFSSTHASTYQNAMFTSRAANTAIGNPSVTASNIWNVPDRSHIDVPEDSIYTPDNL